MHYFIIEGDIDMVIKDWEDEWKIPVLTKDLLKGQWKKRQRREKHNLKKSQCPRNGGRARQRQKR
jgi:hypothetical protein